MVGLGRRSPRLLSFITSLFIAANLLLVSLPARPVNSSGLNPGEISRDRRTSSAPAFKDSRAALALNDLPLSFQPGPDSKAENEGRLSFVSRRPGAEIVLSSNEAMLTIRSESDNDHGPGENTSETTRLKMRFVGAAQVQPEGVDKRESKSSYFLAGC
ncbi:MAG: hypothetical protein DMF61_05675 [Blastocatellia bacterium AA13]|nr:MAG: hypothetical protein DMF61_05675 [Blastocatellia bacterium AA13]